MAKKKKAAKKSKPKKTTPTKSRSGKTLTEKKGKSELPDLSKKTTDADFRYLKPSEITVRDGFNPRDTLGDVAPLSKNIKTHGVIQNLVCWKDGDDYVLICGHRRLKAAKDAKLKKVPVNIRTDITNDNQALLVAISENSSENRNTFTPLEEAKAFKRLRDLGYTQNEIAISCGTSPANVSRSLGLLNLPQDILDHFNSNELTAAAAFAIAALNDDDRKLVINEGIGDITSQQQVARILDRKRSKEALDSKGGNESKGMKHSKGVFRGARDARNATHSIFRVYDEESRKTWRDKYEWALCALLFILGEVSYIDPVENRDEFEAALEVLRSEVQEIGEEEPEEDEEEDEDEEPEEDEEEDEDDDGWETEDDEDDDEWDDGDDEEYEDEEYEDEEYEDEEYEDDDDYAYEEDDEEYEDEEY